MDKKKKKEGKIHVRCGVMLKLLNESAWVWSTATHACLYSPCCWYKKVMFYIPSFEWEWANNLTRNCNTFSLFSSGVSFIYLPLSLRHFLRCSLSSSLLFHLALALRRFIAYFQDIAKWALTGACTFCFHTKPKCDATNAYYSL